MSKPIGDGNMLKSLNARLVFIRSACVVAALSYVIYLLAACACAQGSYGNVPLSQGLQQGNVRALPGDWPPPLSVPGMEKVTGLVQGDNNLSYAVRVISQDAGKVNFQVDAFCVSNPESEYAILHILDKPLMGVVDQEKKTLQIDFSPLATGLSSVEVIDRADADRVLLQRPDTVVLHTVMAVQSMDSSQVKFSVTDMSLLQPDGVLDEFSLPGPVPAVFDPVTARFSTVAFDEMTNILQQNIVYVQQNTVINVVNVVNQVNVINVVDFGGFGCGGWGGVPFGGYGGYPGLGYGGYGGCGGYGEYGGAPYGGFMPYSDPLPLAAPQPAPPLAVPDDVPLYDTKPVLEPNPAGGTTPAPAKLPVKDKDTATAKRPAVKPAPAARTKAADVRDAKAPDVKAVQATVKPTPAPNIVKTPDDMPAIKTGPRPADKAAAAKARARDNKPAVKAAAPQSAKIAANSVPKPVPAPKTNVAKGTKPRKEAKAPIQSAPARQVSAPGANLARAPQKSALSHAKPAAAAKAPAKGGRHK